MEWLSTIVAAIVGLAGAFGGGSIIYARQTRRLKEIENEAKQSDEWRKLYEEMKAEAKERDRKIDVLYEEISKHRDAKADLRKELATLETEVAKMRFLKCEKLYCSDRVPPTELTQPKQKRGSKHKADTNDGR